MPIVTIVKTNSGWFRKSKLNLKKKKHFTDPNVISTFSFIRKGIIGSHKEEMTAELIEKFDNWTREYNLKHGTSIEY